MMVARPNPHRYTRATITVDLALWNLLEACGRHCILRPGGGLCEDAMCANRATSALREWRGKMPGRSRLLGLRYRARVVMCRDVLDMMERVRPGCVDWGWPKRWLDAAATVALSFWGKEVVCVDDGERVLVMTLDEWEATKRQRSKEELS